MAFETLRALGATPEIEFLNSIKPQMDLAEKEFRQLFSGERPDHESER
jgi:hypothetical protein